MRTYLRDLDVENSLIAFTDSNASSTRDPSIEADKLREYLEDNIITDYVRFDTIYNVNNGFYGVVEIHCGIGCKNDCLNSDCSNKSNLVLLVEQLSQFKKGDDMSDAFRIRASSRENYSLISKILEKKGKLK